MQLSGDRAILILVPGQSAVFSHFFVFAEEIAPQRGK
jgi:hypothetical protein